MANWQTYARDAQLIRSTGFFLRLAEKTQVFTPRETPHTRMRMSHTMDVLAFAQRLVSGLREETLKALDAGLGAWSIHECRNQHLWLATAIALGHDLGHTPFGHAGEAALQEALPHADFHHNWQSARVLEHLEQAQCDYDSHDEGMGVSLDVLDGIINHTRRPDSPVPVGDPWLSSRRGHDDLRSNGAPRTAAGLIVVIADEVAQRVSDIADAWRQNVIQPEQLRGCLPPGADGVLAKLARYSDDGAGEVRHRHYVARTELQAALTHVYSARVNLVWDNRPEDVVAAASKARGAAAKDEYQAHIRECLGMMGLHDARLHEVIRENVYSHERVHKANRRARVVVRDLAQAYSRDPKLMLDWYWERSVHQCPGDLYEANRGVADYVAAMTDGHALKSHRELFGSSFE